MPKNNKIKMGTNYYSAKGWHCLYVWVSPEVYAPLKQAAHRNGWDCSREARHILHQKLITERVMGELKIPIGGA